MSSGVFISKQNLIILISSRCIEISLCMDGGVGG